MTGTPPLHPAPRTRDIAATRHGVVLLAASVMPVMAIISLVPVLPLLMREFAGVAGSEFLVPIALTIPALCVALFSPVAGWLADRIGRKILLVSALVLYAACGIVPWFLDDLFQIIAARIALGMTEAVIMTVATTLIGDYFVDERREKWIALQVATTSVSAIVLIAVGGLLGEILGSRGPFLLYLLGLPIAGMAAMILFEPEDHARSTGVGATAFPFARVLPLVVITLGVGIVFYTLIVQLGPILELSGPVSPATIGMVGAVTNLSVAGGSFIFHKLKQHAGRMPLALGLLLAALGYAGAAYSTSLPSIAGFAALACVGSGILLPNMLTWTMRGLPPEFRGRGTGLWTGAFFLGQFLAPLVAAAVVGATSGLASALLVYAGVVAVGSIVAALSFRLGSRTG